ncbi:alanine--tRNA ligase [SAR86 cluster bacterium]|nr:alanine--tRNA ligase [SAR86 cluster bacterium]
MKLNQVRQSFLNYFKNKNHKILPSSGLVPKGDDSLLFTNAGMVQFKDTFLGLDNRDYSATTSQKCLRVGGKHNDLENVGFTTRHQTFFEMLGNFSFGEYFKEKAIEYAWEFLTEELKLPEDRLWVTVHKDDKESEEIWLKKIGVSSTRLAKLGDDDNFWSMGDTGPCGPCSEIFFDNGKNFDGKAPGEGDTGERYIEIWNLVFMEFNRDSNGKLSSLPVKCVDTGMGLERMCSVMQEVGSNFDIDIFKSLKNLMSKHFTEPNDQSLNVLADHLRAIFFLMAENIIPSNEGRGYVLRRLIRRAVRHGYKMGSRDPFLSQFLTHLKNDFKEDFGDDFLKFEKIQKDLLTEEQLFFKTLKTGIEIFEASINDTDGKQLDGAIAFKLHDTYGFPVDLTMAMAQERGLKVDQKGFDKLMKKQREGSKSSSMFKVLDITIDPKINSEFVGYQEQTAEGSCVALFDEEGNSVTSLSGEGFAIFSKTPFYAESGGQVADTGIFKSTNLKGEILNCKKVGDFHLHEVTIAEGSLELNADVELIIDSERREKIVSNHSATHLLHSALRKVLGENVEQRGSLVNEEKLRFDFSHSNKVTDDQIMEIEDIVNLKIEEAIDTKTEVLPYEDALKTGALAFFGDKYGEKVRVVYINGDFSVEFCGGTHVKNTSEIGGFAVTNETSVSSGVRRIEAISGEKYYKESQNALKTLELLSVKLNVPQEKIADRVDELLESLKNSKKNNPVIQAKELRDEQCNFSGSSGVIKIFENASLEILRKESDKLKSDKKIVFAICLSTTEDKLIYIVSSNNSDEAPASEIIKSVNDAFDGSGGGRADFAQGGSSQKESVDEMVTKLKGLFKG